MFTNATAYRLTFRTLNFYLTQHHSYLDLFYYLTLGTANHNNFMEQLSSQSEHPSPRSPSLAADLSLYPTSRDFVATDRRTHRSIAGQDASLRVR